LCDGVFSMEGNSMFLDLILSLLLASGAAAGDVPTAACPMPAWWTAAHGAYTKAAATQGRHAAPPAQRARIIVDDGVPFMGPARIIVDDGVPFERFDLDRRG